MKSLCIVVLFFLSCVYSLNITSPDGSIKYFNSPSDPIRGYNGIFNLTNLHLVVPPDTFGCKEYAAGSVVGKVIIAASDDCASSIRITNAWKAGAAGIIMIWQKTGAPAGVQYTWASQDIKASEGVDLPTVELSLADGTTVLSMLSANPNITVSMVNGDPNIWFHYFGGGGMIFWQVSLSIILFVPLCIAYYKFFLIIKGWPSGLIWAFLNTQSYLLYCVIVACSLSLAYVAVDPLHSRGIYNNVGDVVLTTLGIDPTLVGTFLITLIWVTSFNSETVLSRQQFIVKLSKIFLVIIFLVFALDIISSFIKGYYINTKSTQYIIGIYYIVAAFGIVVFYIYVAVKIKRQIKNIEDLFPSEQSSTLSAVKATMNRNMWLFSVFWGIWILTAAVAVTSINLQPLPRLINFWFIYAIIGCVNLCHVFMVQTSGTTSAGKNSASTNIDMEDSTFKSTEEVTSTEA